jgi:uncharacterized membrane protein (UPF0182 family)
MTNHSARNEKPSLRERSPESELAPPRLGRITAIGAIVVVVAFIALGLTGYFEKWLWMRQLDYIGIFWTVLSVQCAMAGVCHRIRILVAQSA